MALLSVNQITPDSIDIEATTALNAADVAGDSVDATSGLLINVNNADVGAKVVTVAAPVATKICGSFGQLPVSDIVVNIPAGESRAFTIPQGYANSSAQFAWTYDSVTNVSVAVFNVNANG